MVPGNPSALAFGRFDPEPMGCDDQDYDIGERGESLEAGGGLERSGLQVGAGSLDAALEFMVQGADLLLKVFLGGLGVVEAGAFIFALPDDRLSNEFSAGFAAPGVSGLGGGFLQRLELILDLFHFTFFNGAIGSVNDAVARLLIERVDFDPSAVGIDGNDDVANGNGALVSRLQEMSRRNSVFANFEIDLTGAFPGIEQRSRIDCFGASQNRLFVEHQCAVNNFVADNGKDGLANFIQRNRIFADESGGGEGFPGGTGHRPKEDCQS